MDTLSAFAMGEAHRNDPLMVFDWNKAAEIIRDTQPKEAFAGLDSDFEYTAGYIWRDGKPVKDDYTYLASVWAEPLLVADNVVYKCWKFFDDTPGWGSATKWPDSALEIINSMKEVSNGR